MPVHTPETQEEEQTQALQNLAWDRDAVPFLDEDGARLQLGVDIVEIDEGAVASGSIDISGASVTLEKAGSGTGAYSTTGVTQPTLTKSSGRVEVDEDLAGGEWTAGDAWRLVISGVTADDSEGNTYNLPTFTWSGGIGDWGEIKADIDQIDSDIGSPTTSPTANASGNVSERFEELLANRLTSTRAGNLDSLDVAVSTRSTLSQSDILSDTTPFAGANIDAAVSTRSSHDDPDPNGRIDNLAWTRATSTHSHANNTTEQDVIENTGVTDPTEVRVLLDLNGLTNDHTIRVYEKIDGTNYRSIDPPKAWTSADEDGVRISFTAQDDYKVTLQSATGEGSSVNVPVIHSNRSMAN